MRKKFDIIYSIGRDCACSDYLFHNKLRLCSGPLDWLTNASVEQRFEMLLNDFKDFLNSKDFQFLPKDPNVFNDEKCDYYENIKTGFYFYHDFPIGIPFEKTFPEVQKKYSRRIKRFYENINKKERVLLVWFSHYTDTPDDTWKKYCKQFCKKVGKRIDFLIIEHKENMLVPQKVKLANNITKYLLHTIDKDEFGRNTTDGNIERCTPIFSQLSIRLKFREQLLQNWYKFQKRIFCSLIPVKKWRRNARRHIQRRIIKQ